MNTVAVPNLPLRHLRITFSEVALWKIKPLNQHAIKAVPILTCCFVNHAEEISEMQDSETEEIRINEGWLYNSYSKTVKEGWIDYSNFRSRVGLEPPKEGEGLFDRLDSRDFGVRHAELADLEKQRLFGYRHSTRPLLDLLAYLMDLVEEIH